MSDIQLTVRQLNSYVRSLLEGDANLSSLTLTGELSNFKNHYASGHCYFVIKDSDASIKAVMFRRNAARLNFLPADGMLVACRGYVSIYEKDGSYQFYAENMVPLRQGDLAAEFERIKNKLMNEGLFDTERKKILIAFPKTIGVITSDTGAALQDIINIISRRYPICKIKVFPSLVQGMSAPKSLISSLDKAYVDGEIDTIIIGRGGGSAEDLSSFNDEQLARKISVSPVPVISAVGHETDFTICDFVSDLRAPTPSAAAELAVPDKSEILQRFSSLLSAINNEYSAILNSYDVRLKRCILSRVFKNPDMLYNPFEQRLAAATELMNMRYKSLISINSIKYSGLNSLLLSLSPKKTFKRGYSAVYKNGNNISKVENISVGDSIDVVMSDGDVTCSVIKIETED